uniref:Uncharacterized protein n=1 Tax=Schistocephalus solidus TaxID=70667 RepID=A0A0X3PZC8_SCHSO
MPESPTRTYQIARKEVVQAVRQKATMLKDGSPSLETDPAQNRKERQLNRRLRDKQKSKTRTHAYSEDTDEEDEENRAKEVEESKKKGNTGVMWYDAKPPDSAPYESNSVGEESSHLGEKKPDREIAKSPQLQPPHVHGTMCKLLSWVGLGDYAAEGKADPEKESKAELAGKTDVNTPKTLPDSSGGGGGGEEVAEASDPVLIRDLQKKIRQLLKNKKHVRTLERSLKDLDDIPPSRRVEFLQKVLNKLDPSEGDGDQPTSENEKEDTKCDSNWGPKGQEIMRKGKVGVRDTCLLPDDTRLLGKAKTNGSRLCDHPADDSSMDSDIESIFEREEAEKEDDTLAGAESTTDDFQRSRSEERSSSDSEPTGHKKQALRTEMCPSSCKTTSRGQKQCVSNKYDHPSSSQAILRTYGDCPRGGCSAYTGGNCSCSGERSSHSRKLRDGRHSDRSNLSSPSRSTWCKNMQSDLDHELEGVFCRGCKKEKEENTRADWCRGHKNISWRERSCPDLSYKHTCGAGRDWKAVKVGRNGKPILGYPSLQEDRHVLLVSPWALDVVLPSTGTSERCQCPACCHYSCTHSTKYTDDGTTGRRDRSREHKSHQEGQKGHESRPIKPCRHEPSKHPKNKKKARTTGLDETALRRLRDLLHEYTYRDKSVGGSTSASDSEEENARKKKPTEESSHGTDAPVFGTDAVDKRLSVIQNLYPEKKPVEFDEALAQVEHNHDSSDEDECRKRHPTQDEAVQCSACSSRRDSGSFDEDTLRKMRDILNEASQVPFDEKEDGQSSRSCSSSSSSCSHCCRHNCSRERKTKVKKAKVKDVQKSPKKELKQKERNEDSEASSSSSSASDACRIGAFWRRRFRRCQKSKCSPCSTSRPHSKGSACKPACCKARKSHEVCGHSPCRGRRHHFRRSELHELAQFMKAHNVTGPPSRDVGLGGRDYDRLVWRGPLHSGGGSGGGGGGGQQPAYCQCCQSQSALNRIPVHWQLCDRKQTLSRSLASLPTSAYVTVELGPIPGPEAESSSNLQLQIPPPMDPRQKLDLGDESKGMKKENLMVAKKAEEEVVISEVNTGDAVACPACSRDYRHAYNDSPSPFSPSRRKVALSGTVDSFLDEDWSRRAQGEHGEREEVERVKVGEKFSHPKQQEHLGHHHDPRHHHNHHHHHHHNQNQKRTNQQQQLQYPPPPPPHRYHQQQQQQQQKIKTLSEHVDKLLKRSETKERKREEHDQFD